MNWPLQQSPNFQFFPFLSPMAPSPSSAASSSAQKQLIRYRGSVRRTEAPRWPSPSFSPPPKKFKSMVEIMAKARHAVLEREDYTDIGCEQCGSGDRADELLLCDKCDRGFHMSCVRPIVVRVPIGSWFCPSCSGQSQRCVRSRGLFFFLCFWFDLFRIVLFFWSILFCIFCIGFSQTKIIDFFRLQKCTDVGNKCTSPQGNFHICISNVFILLSVSTVIIMITICLILLFRYIIAKCWFFQLFQIHHLPTWKSIRIFFSEIEKNPIQEGQTLLAFSILCSNFFSLVSYGLH